MAEPAATAAPRVAIPERDALLATKLHIPHHGRDMWLDRC
jgi:hypothetical protein